ncbi:MAG TPA: hypothetical protein VHZ51_18200 [Ktedonobacteraceae bacterium]|nr:hypothetical protein [Ktedonobacteraceae bacterium]
MAGEPLSSLRWCRLEAGARRNEEEQPTEGEAFWHSSRSRPLPFELVGLQCSRSPTRASRKMRKRWNDGSTPRLFAAGSLSIPSSDTSATLSFFYWPTTNDSSSYAWQEADIINSSGQVIQQLFRKTVNNRTWISSSFDLSKYVGQKIGVQFLDHETSNGGSYYAYMYVDDVTLTAH